MTQPWHSTVVTLFPDLFPGPLGHSLTGKALNLGLWRLDTIQIRDFAHDRHKTVDDTPYGGGAGMVLKPDVVHDALESAKSHGSKRQLIYLTPRGKPLNQEDIRRYSWQTAGLIILCGRYEGVDERVLQYHQLEEVSIGDYVLTGGELAAFPLLDACVRLLPGVIGKEESHQSDSFEGHLLEHPLYTKPQVWQGYNVPEVLLSGDHQKIARWRLEQAQDVTRERRPDLWAKYHQNESS